MRPSFVKLRKTPHSAWFSATACGMLPPRQARSTEKVKTAHRTLVSLLAVVMIVAAIPPCVCAPMAETGESHDCCASETALLAGDRTCCDPDESVAPTATSTALERGGDLPIAPGAGTALPAAATGPAPAPWVRPRLILRI